MASLEVNLNNYNQLDYQSYIFILKDHVNYYEKEKIEEKVSDQFYFVSSFLKKEQ